MKIGIDILLFLGFCFIKQKKTKPAYYSFSFKENTKKLFKDKKKKKNCTVYEEGTVTNQICQKLFINICVISYDDNHYTTGTSIK